jgi:hypothetical protein
MMIMIMMMVIVIKTMQFPFTSSQLVFVCLHIKPMPAAEPADSVRLLNALMLVRRGDVDCNPLKYKKQYPVRFWHENNPKSALYNISA